MSHPTIPEQRDDGQLAVALVLTCLHCRVTFEPQGGPGSFAECPECGDWLVAAELVAPTTAVTR